MLAVMLIAGLPLFVVFCGLLWVINNCPEILDAFFYLYVVFMVLGFVGEVVQQVHTWWYWKSRKGK